jgi:universal stress protein E
MFKKIVVIANGAETDPPALRRAVSCIADEGEIELFDVSYEPALEGYLGNTQIYEPLRSRVVRERQERADALARSAAERGVHATARAVWGHPLAAAVAKEAAARAADLVVFAPAHGAERGLTHSDWQLVLTCPAPVLVVKGDGVAPYRTVVAAVDPYHAHAKPASLDAAILRHARALSAETRAALTVLHCYVPPSQLGGDLAPPIGGEELFAAQRKRELQALAAGAGLPESAARLIVGEPHRVLHALIESGDADVVVMGALARGRFSELVVGHTAERVLHESRADVLVVKSEAR